MTVWLADHRDREALNREWLAPAAGRTRRPGHSITRAG
jgi:hypothetical protein